MTEVIVYAILSFLFGVLVGELLMLFRINNYVDWEKWHDRKAVR